MKPRLSFVVWSALVLVTAFGCQRAVAPHDESALPSLDTAVDQAAAPKSPLQVEPAVCNLGDVPINSDRPFKAILTNKSRQTVSIHDVGGNCSCANVRLDKAEISPSESATLTGTYRAGNDSGPFGRTLKVHFGDPVRGIDVRLQGRTVRTLSIEPDLVILRPDFRSGQRFEQKVTLRNKSPQTVRFAVPEGLINGLTCTMGDRSVKPGEKIELVLKADPIFLTSVDTRITLANDYSSERDMSFALRVAPPQALRISPSAVRLGVGSREQISHRDIHVSISGRLLSDLLLIDVTPPEYMTLREKDLSSLSRARLTFRIGDSSRLKRADLSGKITVTFGLREKPKEIRVLTIPVTGFVRDV